MQCFQEFQRFKFVLDKKGNTRYINKVKFEYINAPWEKNTKTLIKK